MHVDAAEHDDIGALARLLWLHAAPEEQARQSATDVAGLLAVWWHRHEDTHSAFVARSAGGDVVGMAWVALVPRVPRPGDAQRRSADLQSVFVLPEHRGRGIGSALVAAALRHAGARGADRVTVHSSRRAVALYERAGFTANGQYLQRPVSRP